MGRKPRTERLELDEIEDTNDRDERKDFDNEMFSDAVESPLHIPRSEWPDGLALRWVSIEVAGAADNRNWSVKTAVGWSPVRRGKYPKIDRRYPVIPMPGAVDNAADSIIFGGMCLCERDIRLVERDKKRQEKATQEAGRTIETYVEGGNSLIPRRDFGSSPVQYERGVRPAQFKE